MKSITGNLWYFLILDNICFQIFMEEETDLLQRYFLTYFYCYIQNLRREWIWYLNFEYFLGKKLFLFQNKDDISTSFVFKGSSSEGRETPSFSPATNPAFAIDPNEEECCKSSTFQGFQKSGRITPPATTIPRFRKYCVEDFHFLKVLGKGSFGKVSLNTK